VASGRAQKPADWCRSIEPIGSPEVNLIFMVGRLVQLKAVPNSAAGLRNDPSAELHSDRYFATVGTQVVQLKSL